MEITETLITKFLRTMKLNKFVTLESGLRPKGGVGGILEGIPSLGGEHLNADGGFIFEKIKYIPEDFFQVLNKGHIYPNDIIVVKDGATTGKTSFVDNDFPHKRAVVNEHLFIVRVDPKAAFPKYVFYYLFSSEGQKQILSDFRGATIGGISRNFPQKVACSYLIRLFLKCLRTEKPKSLVDFLDRDRKTEQIDELIRIKERQIELLQEQRTTLINQAVTKGLDPNVEMKPSGVEWIGEIPAHWEVRRNKRIFRERDDRSETGEEELLTVSHITGVSPRAEKKNVGMFLAETMEGYKHCSAGDLVINTMWAWMGALGVSSFEGIVSPSYNVYELKSSEYMPKYYDYLYRTPNHIKEIIRWSKGIWHSRWRLYPDAFFSMSTITPPFSEQAKIVDFLNCKNKQIDELVSAEQRKIQLLKEYRQSLISEAVTGKIDVRNGV